MRHKQIIDAQNHPAIPSVSLDGQVDCAAYTFRPVSEYPPTSIRQRVSALKLPQYLPNLKTDFIRPVMRPVHTSDSPSNVSGLMPVYVIVEKERKRKSRTIELLKRTDNLQRSLIGFLSGGS